VCSQNLFTFPTIQNSGDSSVQRASDRCVYRNASALFTLHHYGAIITERDGRLAEECKEHEEAVGQAESPTCRASKCPVLTQARCWETPSANRTQVVCSCFFLTWHSNVELHRQVCVGTHHLSVLGYYYSKAVRTKNTTNDSVAGTILTMAKFWAALSLPGHSIAAQPSILRHKHPLPKQE